MLTVVTGADGFVGRAVAARMAATGYPGTVRLVDRKVAPARGYETVAAELTDRAARAAALAGADRIIHLAALPGGAAETDPALSRAVNLDVTLDILSNLAPAARLVHASSIAVFGTIAAAVDDATVPCPSSVYGTHKRMAEIAVVDATRRGADAVSVRLPGIVARPGMSAGFTSAFMSEVFSSFLANLPITLPVGPDATMWLLSVEACADALLHAAAMPPAGPAVVMLPALRVTMADLIETLARVTGNAPSLAAFASDRAVEATFGRLPPLETAAADRLGFRHDGTLDRLVVRALAALATGA